MGFAFFFSRGRSSEAHVQESNKLQSKECDRNDRNGGGWAVFNSPGKENEMRLIAWGPLLAVFSTAV